MTREADVSTRSGAVPNVLRNGFVVLPVDRETFNQVRVVDVGATEGDEICQPVGDRLFSSVTIVAAENIRRIIDQSDRGIFIFDHVDRGNRAEQFLVKDRAIKPDVGQAFFPIRKDSRSPFPLGVVGNFNHVDDTDWANRIRGIELFVGSGVAARDGQDKLVVLGGGDEFRSNFFGHASGGY